MNESFNEIEYDSRIIEIPIEKIEVNEFNPRKKFVESEEDELIDSIVEKGILNPIIVYKKRRDGKYVILDGERRYRASIKLNKEKIPAHVLKHEPNVLENLSMMFHIHNVREEWTDFAIAISLQRIIGEMGKDIKKLSSDEKKELSRITSLTEYKVNKYLSFLQYPKEVIQQFLDSEKKEKPDKGVDPDILMEMHRPIRHISELFPDFFRKYSIPDIIDSCIRKKANETIKNNREFRFLTKALIATKNKKVRREVMKEKLIEFIKNDNLNPIQIYNDTSEAIYLLKEILKKTDTLSNEILDLDLRRITEDEKSNLKEKVIELINVIEQKLLK